MQLVLTESGNHSISEAEVEHFQKESWLVVPANRLRAHRKNDLASMYLCRLPGFGTSGNNDRSGTGQLIRDSLWKTLFWIKFRITLEVFLSRQSLCFWNILTIPFHRAMIDPPKARKALCSQTSVPSFTHAVPYTWKNLSFFICLTSVHPSKPSPLSWYPPLSCICFSWPLWPHSSY